MLYKIANIIIRKIKKTPDYTLDKALTPSIIFSLLFNRLITLCRGSIFQIIRLRKPICLFLGKRSKITSNKMLTLSGTSTIGSGVTIECLGSTGVVLGHNVTIPDGCFLRCTGVISNIGQGIEIGNNTGLGHFNFINGQGGVKIGDDVIIGPYVNILSENHRFNQLGVPIRQQGVSRLGINIESNVWIGANVTILDGVNIGSGCVIGAGSVVTKSIPRDSVAVGTPCKVVKTRKGISNE